MSVIEDVRKVIQDLIAPDLKAIAERQDTAAKLQKAHEAIADARHNELLAKLETFNAIHTARYDAIMRALDIDKRLDAVERGQGKESPASQSV